MQRIALTATLRDDAEAIAAYERHHAAVWPEVIADNGRAGVRRFTIHRRERLLLLVLEVDDRFSLERWAEALDSPRTREWTELMDALVIEVPGEPPGTRWLPLTQVCHEETAR